MFNQGKFATAEVAAVKSSFDSLHVITDELGSYYEKQKTPRMRTAFALLYCLDIFGMKQFDFFETWLLHHEKRGLVIPTVASSQGPAQPNEDAPNYPIRYPFNVINSQLASDIEVITRAVDNREPTASTAEMLERIRMADYLAYAALKPAIDHLKIPECTVLNYFQKAADVRVIPYAPVAVVGVPLKAVKNLYDLLATSHEIGHYVYWSLFFSPTSSQSDPWKELTQKNFRDEILKSVEKCISDGDDNKDGLVECLRNWFEEIFADVYGCLIAGPVSAIYAKEKNSGLPNTQLNEDDGDHPLPALRIYVYTETLRQMAPMSSTLGEMLKKVATELEDEWKEQLCGLWIKPSFILNSKVYSADSIELKFAQVIPLLQHVVAKLCQGVLIKLRDAKNEMEDLWYRSPDSTNLSGLQLWREGFKMFFSQNEWEDCPELKIQQEGDSMILHLVSAQGHTSIFNTPAGYMNHWFEQARDNMLSASEWKIPELNIQEREVPRNANGAKRAWWHYILDANGWATQGPGPGHVGKG